MNAEQALLEIEAMVKSNTVALANPAARQQLQRLTAIIRQEQGTHGVIRERLETIEHWFEQLLSGKSRGMLEEEKLKMNILTECISLRTTITRQPRG